MESMNSFEATIGTDTSLVSEEKAGTAKRKVITLTNTDRNATGGVIYLNFDAEAVVGQGIPLYPTGTWSETIDNRYNPTNKRVFAIASIANTTLAVHERVEA